MYCRKNKRTHQLHMQSICICLAIYRHAPYPELLRRTYDAAGNFTSFIVHKLH